ncbi:MAG: hypothetical protein J6A57_03175 [Ruminococcus sp.]|nr:hypothetical protein [Ruminococcus sp.]
MKKEGIKILVPFMIVGGIVSVFFINDMNIKKSTNEFTSEINLEMIENPVQQNDVPQYQYTQEKRNLEKAVDYTIADKSDVYHMMLNTIDYYNSVSGSIIRSDSANLINVITFQTDLLNTKAYSKSGLHLIDDDKNISNISLSDVDFDKIVYCADGLLTTVIDGSSETMKNAVTYLSDCSPIDDSKRISIADDGYPICRYRQNPTNVPFASICLFPQEMALGFLQDKKLWEITGITKKDDLTCYVIEGKTNKSYGEKINAATFKFLVDVNTGVLIQYEGFSADGTLSDYMYTMDIKFNDNAKPVNVLG